MPGFGRPKPPNKPKPKPGGGNRTQPTKPGGRRQTLRDAPMNKGGGMGPKPKPKKRGPIR